MVGAQRLTQTGCFGFRAGAESDLLVGSRWHGSRVSGGARPPTVDLILARTHPEDLSLVLERFRKSVAP